MGRPLSREQCLRLSLYYSGILAVFSIPLAGWIAAANTARDGAAAGSALPMPLGQAVLIGAATLALATGARYALMAVLSRRVA